MRLGLSLVFLLLGLAARSDGFEIRDLLVNPFNVRAPIVGEETAETSARDLMTFMESG